MSWIDLGIAMATAWCLGSFAPVIVEVYRADMANASRHPANIKALKRFAVLILLIILQVIT